ncbi:MAG: TlpA disulfide reductase family protein [Balneolaceae bacterium]
MSINTEQKQKNRKRTFIEWGALIGIFAFFYFTGLHTQVIGTMHRGLLATGLITPSIPGELENFPEASSEFYFADEDEMVQSLEQYEGDVIFMNIWATWCPPCIAEMPSIYSLYNRFDEDDNVTFLLVSVDEEFDKAKEFMKDRDFSMPIYHFRNRAPGAYESSVVPTTYVITPDGKLAFKKEGLSKYDIPKFEAFLRNLANDK